SLIGAQRAIVFELDQEAACLRARAIRGVPVDLGFTLPVGCGVAGLAALRLQPTWTDDVIEHPLPGDNEPSLTSVAWRGTLARTYRGGATLAVPVSSRGATRGAISVGWDDVHEPAESEVRLLSALGRQAAIAMENARLVGDL